MNSRPFMAMLDGSDQPVDAGQRVLEWRNFLQTALQSSASLSRDRSFDWSSIEFRLHSSNLHSESIPQCDHPWFTGELPIALLACQGFLRRTRSELLQHDWSIFAAQLEGALTSIQIKNDVVATSIERHLEDHTRRITAAWELLFKITGANANTPAVSTDYSRHIFDQTDVLALACAEYARLADNGLMTSPSPEWIEQHFQHLDVIAHRAVQFPLAERWLISTCDTVADEAKDSARVPLRRTDKASIGEQAFSHATRWIVSAATCVSVPKTRTAAKDILRGSTDSPTKAHGLHARHAEEKRSQLARFLFAELTRTTTPIRAAAAMAPNNWQPTQRISWKSKTGEVLTWLASAGDQSEQIVLRVFDRTGEPSTAYDGFAVDWLGVRARVQAGRVVFDRSALVAATDPNAIYGSDRAAALRASIIRAWNTSMAGRLSGGDTAFTLQGSEP
jgi:hypothetical protein